MKQNSPTWRFLGIGRSKNIYQEEDRSEIYVTSIENCPFLTNDYSAKKMLRFWGFLLNILA